jgi:hypothetical protein
MPVRLDINHFCRGKSPLHLRTRHERQGKPEVHELLSASLIFRMIDLEGS